MTGTCRARLSSLRHTSTLRLLRSAPLSSSA